VAHPRRLSTQRVRVFRELSFETWYSGFHEIQHARSYETDRIGSLVGDLGEDMLHANDLCALEGSERPGLDSPTPTVLSTFGTHKKAKSFPLMSPLCRLRKNARDKNAATERGKSLSNSTKYLDSISLTVLF